MLGRSGVLTSRLTLGTMTFGDPSRAGSSVGVLGAEMADRLVGKAIDAGIDHFNTADAYSAGRAEELLGDALFGKRSDVLISTKVGHRMGPSTWQAGLSRAHIIAACDASLRRLRTDYIDIYLFHLVDRFTPLEETLAAMDALVKAGKVRYAGVSNWPAWLSAKAAGIQALRGYEPLAASEIYYSLVARDAEFELMPFMEDAGIGGMVWSPLSGGYLTGKYRAADREGSDGRFDRVSSMNFMPIDPVRGQGVLDVLGEIGAARGLPMAAIALAWVLSRRWVSTVLLGATSEAQLDQNLAAADLVLTAEEVQRLDDASRIDPPYPNWFSQIAYDRRIAAALAR